ncbi:MAG TPA: hypothetical protein VK092_04640, partial [Deinococcales bacterium]|nr:hypothetical protein [Deinococcales bacterium]
MNVLLLPVIVPLFGAALLMVFRRARARFLTAVTTAVLTLAVQVTIAVRVFREGPVAAQMAGWEAPFGITLAVDGLSAVLLVLSGTVGLLSVFFVNASLAAEPKRGYANLLKRAREIFGAHALFQFLFMGVNLSFITGDVFNL